MLISIIILAGTVVPAAAEILRPVAAPIAAHDQLHWGQGESRERLGLETRQIRPVIGAEHPSRPEDVSDGGQAAVSTQAEVDQAGPRPMGVAAVERVDSALLCGTLAIVVVIGASLLYRHFALVRRNRRPVTNRDAAEVASRATAQLLADMGHEIRTPLNAVANLARLALETQDAERAQGALRGIDSSARSLLGIVDEVLAYAEIASGRKAMASISFRLREVLDKVLAIARPPAQEKGLQLTCELSPEVSDIVTGDPRRLERILVNLTGTAVKLTETGGVALSVSLDADEAGGGRLRFRVKATGIGVAGEGLGRVFSPFGQSDASTAPHDDRTGLGLVIAKGLVEAMGGRIEVRSRPGEGSELGFSVPLPPVPNGGRFPASGPCDFPANGELVVADDAFPDACQGGGAALGASRPMPAAVLDGHGGRVLVAEDNPLDRETVQGLLRRLGVGCDLVVNGQEALDLLRFCPDEYGLVLMDEQMPVMDGCEATRLIRGEEALNGLPIVAMTTDAMDGGREKFLACGMDDLLSKPIEPGLFDQMVLRWLSHPLGPHELGGHRYEAASGSLPVAGYADRVQPGLQTGTRAIDRAAGIRWADGDADLYRRLLTEFRRSYKDKIGSLVSETAVEHPEEIAKLAHALKSSGALIGAARLAHAAAELDAAIQRDAKPDVDRLAETKESLAAVIRELSNESPSDQPSADARAATGHACGALEQEDGRAAILVVDDEPGNLLLIKEFLSPEHRVYCAQRGEQVLRLADSEPGPDLILLDVVMPELDGFEVCRRLKLNPSTREIPVVFITGKTDVVDEQKGLALGAIDYIQKPFNRAVLQARVRNHVALKRQGDVLERLSGMDALTGIANRRRLDEVLEREWKRAIRDQSTLALMMIDVDYFKAFNDRYGHDGGDECLRLLGKTLAKACRRSTDLVARYGGEELAWVMPKTDAEGAAMIARELLAAIRDLRIPHAGSAVSDCVTASIGVWAARPKPGEMVKDFVKQADERLYRAKRAGRDRMVSG